MAREWLSTMAAGLCLSLPACNLLLTQTPPSDLSALVTAKRAEPPETSGVSVATGVPSHPESTDSAIQLAVDKETIIEPVHYPATVTRAYLIPEPRGHTESPAGMPSPPEQGANGSPPDGKAEPAEEPPVLQALRCYLDGQPAEAVARLGRYDKSSQDLLLCLLPLTVRVTEGSLDRSDSREASAVLKQMDRVAERVSASLRPRAKLSIKKMCFCSVIEGYGKYLPRSDAKGFLPGEQAKIYVELENLRDQPQGNAYSIRLLSHIDVYDFKKEKFWLRHEFDDYGPDVSQSERHDFYMWYLFEVPRTLPPGFYTLDLTIIDEPTRRKVSGTLDFRVTSGHSKGHW